MFDMAPDLCKFDISTKSTVVRLIKKARIKMNTIKRENKDEICPRLVIL
jgi:hypothetical protein